VNALFAAAVERLSRVTGVRGALLVESETAVPVVSELREGINETAVAALAASLFRRTADASRMADFGALRTMQLEAETGHVVAVEAGELILVVVADHDAQLGLVRIEAQRVAETLT
jgi:predicted regulator of Ras-like GTPase activity (Roadblock/LC7/MglB family)